MMGDTVDLTAYPDADLAALANQVRAEQDRRTLIASAPALAEGLARQVHEASGGDGRPWEQPESWAPIPSGAVVTDGGHYFQSTHPANVWGPPSQHPAQWREVWPDGQGGWVATNPDGPQPWDSTQTYYPPAVVTHAGATYDLVHVVATPGQRPDDPAMWAVWKMRV